jgi:hypothetical protein
VCRRTVGSELRNDIPMCPALHNEPSCPGANHSSDNDEDEESANREMKSYETDSHFGLHFHSGVEFAFNDEA